MSESESEKSEKSSENSSQSSPSEDNSKTSSSDNSSEKSGEDQQDNEKSTQMKIYRKPRNGSGFQTSKYLNAIKNHPEEGINWTRFAIFLTTNLKDYDRAEKYYKNALVVEPYWRDGYAMYGLFEESVRRNYDLAESIYTKGSEISGNDGNYKVFLYYAVFLEKVRRNYEKAGIFYQRAYECNKSIPDVLGYYALFCLCYKKNLQAANDFMSEIPFYAKTVKELKWLKLFGQQLNLQYGDKGSQILWFKKYSQYKQNIEKE